MNYKLLLVGVLAIILLGLYFYTMHLEINVAKTCTDESNEQKKADCAKAKQAEGNFVTIFNGVGGLIAAFAVGALAVSQPGETPTKGLTTSGMTGLPEKIAKIVPFAFVITWVICGLLAVYYGLGYSGSAPLTEMAKTWIGTALAGIGAYFGIKPPQNQA